MNSFEPALNCIELAGILGARQTSTTAPHILRRSLSYVECGRKALRPSGAGQALNLQLHASSTDGKGAAAAALNGHAAAGQGGALNASTSVDVILAALCVVARTGDTEGYVPISACLVPVPSARQDASLSIQLPLVGSPPASAAAAEGSAALEGLAVVLISQQSARLALLVTMACQGHSAHKSGSGSGTSASKDSRSRIAAAGQTRCKAVSPCVTPAAAFQLLKSGSTVVYSILRLDQPAQVADGKQQGQLATQLGVLTTHEPSATAAIAASSGSPALPPQGIPFPWIQFGPANQQHGARSSSGSGGGAGASLVDGTNSSSSSSRGFTHNRYSISLEPSTSDKAWRGSGRSVEEARQREGAMGRDCDMLMASEVAGEGQLQDSQVVQAAGEAVASPQQHHQQPPLNQQQQQHQPDHQPLLTFFFTSPDGSRSARTQQRGFRCPLASCRGLRCHSWAGLQQHLQASHSYQDSYFSEPEQSGGDLEAYLRCKPAWCDALGGFLPREMAQSVLDAHPLGMLLGRSHILRAFFYHCPRSQRHLRLGTSRGRCPRDEEEERMEAEAEEAVEREAAARQGWPCAAVPAGNSQGLAAGRTEDDAGGSGQLPVGRPRGGSGGRATGRRRGGGRGRGRKSAAAPVHHRLGCGLELLTRDGRPKFYHSRSCVAMTRQELLGSGDRLEETEGDLLEWQRDCRLRLREQEMLCPEEREFMFQWNLFLHKHPLHADADLPAALRRFAGEQAGQLAQDGPFRRCLLAYLITLWRFRLLTPQQMHELARGLPALA